MLVNVPTLYSETEREEEKLTIASAVETAVVYELGVVQGGTNLLGLAPEIVSRALLVGEDVTGGDENVVDCNALATVGHVQGVVENSISLVVGPSVQVPVAMRAQHDGGLLGGGQSDHLDVPISLFDCVGNVEDDLSREALLAIRVNEREGNGVVSVRNSSEVAIIPAVRAAVQSVDTLGVVLCRVFIGKDVVVLAVNFERAVLDAIGVAAGNGAKVRVNLVGGVVRGVVVATDNVTLDAVLVPEVDVGNGTSKSNEA